MGRGALRVWPLIQVQRPYEGVAFGIFPHLATSGCPREYILASQQRWIFQ